MWCPKEEGKKLFEGYPFHIKVILKVYNAFSDHYFNPKSDIDNLLATQSHFSQ